MLRRLLIGLVVVGALSLAGVAWARVSGPCSSCHTMHNSQGGQVVASGGPNEVLLVSDCVGCHTNTTSADTIVNGTPIVWNNSEPTYPPSGSSSTNTLAGGNFYWVTQSGGNPKGHNVAGIASAETRFSTIPGSTTSYYQVTCAGTQGCHGDRSKSDQYEAMYGAHHELDSTIDGTTVGKSFRFLKGILGKEDGDWEQSVGNSDHNQYKGVDRTGETQDDTSTISHLCAQCHGDFHNGAGNISSSSWGSPWLRHPTDYDMGNTPSGSEYRQYYYSTKGDNLYNPLVPVASSDVSSVVSTVTFNNDTIVMCLSCHRAHGSPYDSIMRWDYKGWPGSGGTNGCVVCHTSKD